jgi:hypothetical protein
MLRVRLIRVRLTSHSPLPSLVALSTAFTPKTRFHLHLKDDGLFSFAGTWERWEHGEPFDSCALIATEAIGVVKPLHDRMTVFLLKEGYGCLLDPKVIATIACWPLPLFATSRRYRPAATSSPATNLQTAFTSTVRSRGLPDFNSPPSRRVGLLWRTFGASPSIRATRLASPNRPA